MPFQNYDFLCILTVTDSFSFHLLSLCDLKYFFFLYFTEGNRHMGLKKHKGEQMSFHFWMKFLLYSRIILFKSYNS